MKNFYLFTKKPTSGQTLLEVIVAIGLILSVLISIAGFISLNIFGQKYTENSIIASNLAREGIEVARHIRDSKRKQSEDFITGSDHFYKLSNRKEGAWYQWLLSPKDPFGGRSFDENFRLKLDADNLYQDYGTITPFKRRIIIDRICSALECGDGICSSGEGSCAHTIGYRVTSQVEWQENTQGKKTHLYELKDFLYNWL